jgi:copper transport protein
MTHRRLWAVSLIVLSLIVLGALPAVAHAQLEATTPVDGEVLAGPPVSVTLEFTEPVTPPDAAIRVYDSSGARVDNGIVESVEGGTVMRTALHPDLDDGTYVATWRAVSADGHPISGAFVFHIGQPGAEVDESLLESLLGGSRAQITSALAGVARWVTYVASLVVIGVFAFGTRIETTDAGTRWLRVLSWIGVAASLLQIPLFAMVSTGLGLAALGTGSDWADAATSGVGLAAVIRAIGFVMMALVSIRWRNWMGWLSVTLLVGAELVTGHTRTTDPGWLVMAADAIHVLSAGIWFGGLVALALVLKSRREQGDAEGGAEAVAVFSRLAVWTVLALTGAGLALAWSQVRAGHALTSTTYGWTLLAKLGLVALVIGVAVYNNRVLVPKIAKEKGTESTWFQLGQTIRIEILGLVLVVAVTAFLVNLEPAAEAAGVSGPSSTYVDFGDQQLNLVIDPNRAGLNTIHATVLSPAGLAGTLEGTVTFEFRMPDEDIGPIIREPLVAGPSHVIHTGSELAIPGDWEITVRERVSEFDEEVATVLVRVNG